MDGSTKLLAGLAVFVWGAAGYLYSTQVASTPAPEASTPAPEASASPPASAPSVPPAETSTPVPSAPASASAVAPEEPQACIIRHLPAATFAKKTLPLGFVCEEEDPHRGATELKSRIVKAGLGDVTEGMRFWAGLGWYEMAAFGVLRAHCCVAKPAVKFRFPLACPIDEALRDLEDAAKKGDAAGSKKALDDYRARAICLDRAGQSGSLGQATPPGTGREKVEQLLSY